MEKEKPKYKIMVGDRTVEGDTMKEVADKMKSTILTDAVLSELIQQARQEIAQEIFEEIEKLVTTVELGGDEVEVQVIYISDCRGIDKDWQSLKDKFLGGSQ